MARRSLKQIEESLRSKFAEADDYDPLSHLGSLGTTSPHRGSPVQDPAAFQGLPGGTGRTGSRSSKNSQPARVEPTVGPPPAQIRPSNISKQQWKKMTPDQKQAIAAQPTQSTTPAAAKDETLPKKPFLQREKKYISGLTGPQLDRYNKEQGAIQANKANKMGLGTKAAIGTGATAAGIMGVGYLTPDKKPEDQPAASATTSNTPAADTTVAATPVTDAPPTDAKPDPGAQADSNDTQAALPVDGTETDTRTPASTLKAPPPLQAYPPGTRFNDDLLERSYNRVLEKYRNFLNEETAEEKRQAEILKAIQRSIYGQESGYGKIKTDRPNYAGAMGPMQIMPGTWNDMKRRGLIPKDYDIKNPEHNMSGGNALIADYYKRYAGDPAKVYAAYYGGTGAINKDGTINTHWRDRKNPKAPSVGDYIAQASAKAGFTDVPVVSAKPTATTAAISQEPKPATTAPAVAATTAEPVSTTTPPVATQAPKPEFKDVFNYDAYSKAAERGDDISNLAKFMKPGTAAQFGIY